MSVNYFDAIFNPSKAVNTATDQAVQGTQNALKYATNQYNTATGDINTNYAAAKVPQQTVFDTGTAGVNAYSKALGIGDSGGPGAAIDSFANSSVYQAQLNDALRAAERAASKGGYVSSGNLYDAEVAQRLGQTNQYYNQYLTALQPYFTEQQSGANQLSAINTGQGNALAGIDTSLGNLGYSAKKSIGETQAAGTLGAQNADINSFNSLANLGTKLLGYTSGKAA